MPKHAALLVLAAICSLAWIIHFSAPMAAAQQGSAPAGSAQAEAAPAGGAHGQAGAAEEGYDSAQWWNFLWRVTNFIAYVAILYFLLRKPIANFFNGRRQGIARQIEYLETQARNYEEQAKVMRKQLDELASERLEMLRRYEADGAKERYRILNEAKKAADLIVQRAQVAMDQEVKAARRTLTMEAGQLAMSLAGDLLKKTVTDDDRVRLAHEFVEQVVKLPAKN
jgi:F-type H+-transporting ATPase subunit b